MSRSNGWALALAVLFLLVAVPGAQASTILLTSDGTATDADEYWTSATILPGSGSTVPIIPVGAWASASPARWISYGAATNTGGPSPANDTIVSFYDVFTLPYSVNTGGVTIWADDTAAVWVDGTQYWDFNAHQNTACAEGAIACQQHEGGFVSLTGLSQGAHTLRVDVKQVAGDGFGTLYSGSIQSTPEPGSLLLLGSGLLGLSMVLRRRVSK